jgi:hypothetical protein
VRTLKQAEILTEKKTHTVDGSRKSPDQMKEKCRDPIPNHRQHKRQKKKKVES